MDSVAKKVIRQALGLPQPDRAALAAELLASLGPAPDDPVAGNGEWIAEIERRARRALAGAPGTPWKDVRRRIKDSLARK